MQWRKNQQINLSVLYSLQSQILKFFLHPLLKLAGGLKKRNGETVMQQKPLKPVYIVVSAAWGLKKFSLLPPR